VIVAVRDHTPSVCSHSDRSVRVASSLAPEATRTCVAPSGIRAAVSGPRPVAGSSTSSTVLAESATGAGDAPGDGSADAATGARWWGAVKWTAVRCGGAGKVRAFAPSAAAAAGGPAVAKTPGTPMVTRAHSRPTVAPTAGRGRLRWAEWVLSRSM